MALAPETLTTEVRYYPPALVDPLLRLKRTIRGYILAEGLALAVLLSCAWFWLSFVFDWGLFQAADLDYVRDGSPGVRGTVRTLFLLLLAAGVGIVGAVKIGRRLRAAFRESALALVLERRFPGVLSDRLITAVELADPHRAERYGYSWSMVEATTHEAVARLGTLPLAQVFNWQRLAALAGLALVPLAGLVALAVAQTDTFATWAERNVFLLDTYWPQTVFLELPDFRGGRSRAVPQGGEYRVAARAWKWVVATGHNPQGWRPLTWADLADPGPPWELEGMDGYLPAEGALPDSWLALSLDQVEARVHAAGAGQHPPQAQGTPAELGAGVIAHVRRALRRADAEHPGLDAKTRALLPDAWQDLPPEAVEEYLTAAEYLTPGEVKRLHDLLGGAPVFLPPDAAQALRAALTPLPSPQFSTTFLQRVALAGKAPAFTLGARDLDRLPRAWRSLPARELARTVDEFVATQSPEHLGELLRLQLERLFAELDARAELPHVGRRVRFRRLEVPAEVTVEFEQVLTDEERAQGKAKRGQPRVRRQPGGNEYAYDFKKIDRPLRFRVLAPGASTGWHRLDVKPGPALRVLTREQDEPGYLHGSNARVLTGPYPVALDGEESRFDVPAGTRLRLGGEATKPLRWVRVRAGEQGDAELWARVAARAGLGAASAAGAWDVLGAWGGLVRLAEQNSAVAALDHAPDGEAFTLVLRDLRDDLRFRLDFEDADGLVGSRKFVIAASPDLPPEFKKATFEAVNRKMITAQALIPFSGQVHDDHGLLELAYEVTLVKGDGAPGRKVRFPFRRFVPLRAVEPGRAGRTFERLGDVTPPRVAAALDWPDQLARLGLARAPAAGLAGLLPLPPLEVATDHAFEYPIRTGSAVIGVDDEFLDLLWLRPPGRPDEPPPPGTVPTPGQRVVVQLVGRDNFVTTDPDGRPVPAPQEGRSGEAFEFTVVAEEDLLIETGKREEDLRERTDEVLSALKKARFQLKRVRDEFGTFKDQQNDFRRAANDAQDALRALRDGREAIDQKVVREFRRIYRELVLNRTQPTVPDRIDLKICRPLELLLQPGQQFTKAEDAVEALANRVEAERARLPRPVLEDAVEQTDQLIARLEAVMTEMKKLIEFNQALQALREIIKSQEEIMKQVEKKYKEERAKELQGGP